MYKIIILILLISPSIISATPLRNQYLKEQLDQQKRGQQFKNKYSIASDIEVWKYFGNSQSMYHGAGHWVDLFVEYRPINNLRFNLHPIFVNGTISQGYLGLSSIEHVFGITWKPNNNLFPVLTILDLGKRTIASGLFIEESYVSGGLLEYVFNNKNRIDVFILGTSGVSTTGDLYTINYERFNKKIKTGVTFYTFSSGADFSGAHDKFEVMSGPYLKTTKTNSLKLEFEAIYNPKIKKIAGLGKLGVQNNFECKYCFELYGQYRLYPTQITRHMSYQYYNYIPLSITDRNVNNTQNISGSHNKTTVISAHLNFKFKLNDNFILKSFHEYIKTKTQDNPFRKFYFKEQINYIISSKLNNSSIYAYISNKTLTNKSIAYGYNIYKENIIIGVGTKFFL